MQLFNALWNRVSLPRYERKPGLVLINGLAEQAETWFRNLPEWRNHFEIFLPNLLTFEGETLQQRIEQGLPLSVDYLVDQLHLYITTFLQNPPYYLGGSSTGAKVVVEYAARYPRMVSKLVLIGPSGVATEERMPIVEGVRRSDARSFVESVFYDLSQVDPGLIRYYHERLESRAWKRGMLRSIRGTLGHSIRDKMPLIQQPTLVMCGREDRIIDPVQAESACAMLPNGKFVLIPKCGHAPHQEKAQLVNREVIRFLKEPLPKLVPEPTPVVEEQVKEQSA